MIKVEKRSEDLQINMTPMIDMVFLLIIFFLTATTFAEKERELDVLLPSTRGTGSLSRALEQNVVINVKKGGEVLVAGRLLDDRELVAFVTQRKEARAPAPLKVKVRADRRTPHGRVAEVLDAVLRAGVARAYIETKVIELEP
jgi:biopolymer transport protein ExbD